MRNRSANTFNTRILLPWASGSIHDEQAVSEDLASHHIYSVQELISKYPPKDAEILCRYFPPQSTALDNFAMKSFLHQLLHVHQELLQETQTVVWVYSTVAASSAICNFVLLAFMGPVKYKSSSALFLAFLALVDLVSALSLLVELSYLSLGQLSFYKPSQYFTRQLINFGRILLQFISIHLLTLVAIDRWIAVNTYRGRLFKHYRGLKLLLSLCVPTMAAVLMAINFTPTVEILHGGKVVHVYTCVQMGCRGSRLILYHWRSSADQRASSSRVVVYGNFALLAMVLLPLYTCVWSAASQRVSLEQQYEEEREELATRGWDIFYFHNQRKSRCKVRLPIIYEVDETDTNIDREILFPYSLNILHEPTSLCPYTSADNLEYDCKPVPENADPMPSVNVPRSFDTDIDKWIQRFTRRRKQPLGSRSGTGLYTYSFTTNSYDSNRNALLPSIVSVDKTTQTEHDPRFLAEVSRHICEDCKHAKHRGPRTNFFTKQIVFSINCCCNRAAPIECLTEMTYINETRERNTQNITGHGLTRTRRGQRGQGDISTPKMKVTCTRDQAACFEGCRTSSSKRVRCPMSLQYPAPNSRVFCRRAMVERFTGLSLVACKKSQTSEVFCGGNDPYGPTNASHGLQNLRGSSSQHAYYSHRYTRMPSSVAYTGTSQRADTVRSYTINANYNKLDTISEVSNEDVVSSRGEAMTYTTSDSNMTSGIKPDHSTGVADSPMMMDTTETLSLMNKNSLYIFLQVKNHFLTHSQPLSIIGVPVSLTTKLNSWRAWHSQQINMRLMCLTCLYFFLFFLPWMVEMRLLKFSPVLKMSNYLCGLCQFATLVIFSSQFRRKCLELCISPCNILDLRKK